MQTARSPALFTFVFACLLGALGIPRGTWAEEATKPVTATVTSIGLKGAFPTPRRLSPEDLRRLPRVEARITDARREGAESVHGGVPLFEVLKAGGWSFEPGMAAMRETARAVLVVDAADGYRVVFSLAELDPNLVEKPILLADMRDGRPLRAEEGPWRLVVPGDKRPVRWVRQVTALTLRKE